MKKTRSPALLLCLFAGGPALALWCAASTLAQEQEAPQAFGFDPRIPLVPRTPAMLRSVALNQAFDEKNVVLLPPLGPNDVYDESTDPPKIGTEFEVQAGSETHGIWTDLPEGGRLWTLAVRGPNAMALRLRFDPFKPPPGAELIVYNALNLAETYGPFGRERAEPGVPFWAPTVYSHEVRVEYFVPAEVAAANPPGMHLRITGASQIYPRDMGGGAGNPEGGPQCRIDVTCFPAWADPARATAHIQFQDGGTFLCSGAMVNRLPAFDATPLFLTAAHCINTQAVASTIEVYWLFQTSVCNGVPPALNTVPRTDGSTLLAFHNDADHCLLGLTPNDIPGGLFWAGWASALVPNPTNGTEIHHPAGFEKAISFGVFEGIDPAETCGLADIAYRFDLSDGGQWGGSSGGPVFSNATQQIRAVVSCSEFGGSQCVPGENCWEGSLNTAYGTLAPFLSGPTDAWVDIAYGGVELGTQAQPWDTLTEGYFGVAGGGVMHVVAGTYPARSFLGTKAFELRAESGSVLIGN